MYKAINKGLQEKKKKMLKYRENIMFKYYI